MKHNLVRESTIFLIERKWSELYTTFLKSNNVTSMPPINNSSLLDDQGQLKTGLKEREDYFVVTEKIWKFVSKLYGGGP